MKWQDFKEGKKYVCIQAATAMFEVGKAYLCVNRSIEVHRADKHRLGLRAGRITQSVGGLGSDFVPQVVTPFKKSDWM